MLEPVAEVEEYGGDDSCAHQGAGPDEVEGEGRVVRRRRANFGIRHLAEAYALKR